MHDTPLDPLALHRALALPRAIEERMLLLLRQGRLSKWFSGIGQEAIAVGATLALRPTDWILPLHRNLGVFTTRALHGHLDLDRLFRQLFARAGGYTEGRDRSFHFGSLQDRIVGMISHLGAMLPVACGLALAERRAGTDNIALAFSGDGGTSEGDFHEALNLAAVWKLPVVFLIENNGYGLSTPTHEQYACAALADRAHGYGMPGERIDGNDLLTVHATLTRAAARARRGDGPTLIECLTFRMRGHEEASGTAYVPDALFEEWRPKDPLARYEAHLIAAGHATEATLAATRQTLAEDIRARIDRALDAPPPASDAATEEAAVLAITAHASASHASASHATASHATASHATASHATASHATASHATASHATASHA
ncbi:MAG: thiamine pyrophosphate-dependent dehydrogenase E1 component subunit alpha, partial [Myxococcales bacterium]|nr:thiamine pyrophosphate-dependent dehydrogenase E1 component subunit alpha [Myxococcales bacterium]